MSRRILVPMIALFVVGAIALTGCSERPAGQPANAQTGSQPAVGTNETSTVAGDDQHAHKPGEHGGLIVTIGRDSYHAEAIFEKGGTLRLLMLGKDEARVLEVESQTFSGYAKLLGAAESIPFELAPVPQAGDVEGTTSQFVGQIPESLAGQAVEVTIPSVRIKGERFRLGFASAIEPHGSDTMPTKVDDQEEVTLYLTPGGAYTEADIKANGGVTASQKFKGIMSSHDMNPKPGDKICPVTLTKANSKFTWIVGGKPYEFCCPPCVDEFLKTAKQNPTALKNPDAYVKTR